MRRPSPPSRRQCRLLPNATAKVHPFSSKPSGPPRHVVRLFSSPVPPPAKPPLQRRAKKPLLPRSVVRPPLLHRFGVPMARRPVITRLNYCVGRPPLFRCSGGVVARWQIVHGPCPPFCQLPVWCFGHVQGLRRGPHSARPRSGIHDWRFVPGQTLCWLGWSGDSVVGSRKFIFKECRVEQGAPPARKKNEVMTLGWA